MSGRGGKSVRDSGSEQFYVRAPRRDKRKRLVIDLRDMHDNPTQYRRTPVRSQRADGPFRVERTTLL